MTPIWEARGYRADSAEIKSEQAEDPEGEEAYQRAFAKGAEQKPPRVPNPEYYPKSPSAQAYIKKRDQHMFRSMSGNAPRISREDTPGAPRHLSKRQHSYANNSPSVGSESTHHYGNGTSSPHGLGISSSQPIFWANQQQSCDTKQQQNGRLPLHLEPQFAPVGPSRMLR